MPPTQSFRPPRELPGVPDDVAEKLCFEKVSEEFIGDCDSNAVLFRHKKTGAEIMSLSNTSKKKVFGITFQTVPTYSTGVPDVLQQSVACGLRKYPLKKPFDELVLKSFSTYMYCKVMADRTYYSGNCTTTKELHNFVDVLLDTVFFPKCVEDIQIFRPQGWRYDLNNPSEDLTYQGVVFNQMKEFQFWPLDRDILKLTARQAIFPDATYNFDHAGNPIQKLCLN